MVLGSNAATTTTTSDEKPNYDFSSNLKVFIELAWSLNLDRRNYSNELMMVVFLNCSSAYYMWDS